MSSAFEGLPKTPNLKLNKPGYDNVADIEALNENADILDAEIQGIKNTFVKSVNGINAGDDGNVDLGIIPISHGGTGQTTASGVRNALGLGNTTGALPIANGGTGATTAASARNALGLGNTSGAVPIANGGTGANNASEACANLGAVQKVNNIAPDSNGNVNVASITPSEIVDLIYPVGSLYWSKKSTSPATLFGGTWTRIKDKFILAAGDSYAQGATGGSATVTLTTAQLPAHNHSASSNNISATGNFMLGGTEICQEATGVFFSNGKGGSYSAGHSGGAENPRIGFSNTHSHTVTINNTGSGQAHENMPPYVTYYCWERTA